jgi:hypothetical protein
MVQASQGLMTFNSPPAKRTGSHRPPVAILQCRHRRHTKECLLSLRAQSATVANSVVETAPFSSGKVLRCLMKSSLKPCPDGGKLGLSSTVLIPIISIAAGARPAWQIPVRAASVPHTAAEETRVKLKARTWCRWWSVASDALSRRGEPSSDQQCRLRSE